MAVFLPSEVARLVLGYLESEDCRKTYDEFLNECRHLVECRGRDFFTTIMGMSLMDILGEYCAVYAYISGLKCSGDLKKRLSKCLRLSDKITVIIENIINDTEVESSLVNRSPRIRTLEPRGRYKKAHRRSNSVDSVGTNTTEYSHKCYQLKDTSKDDLNKNVTVQSDECLIESTNLSDLPGHKKDFESNEKDQSIKSLSIDKSDPSKKSFSDLSSKKYPNNLDQDNEKNTPNKNSETNYNETDFRLSLGLVRNSDSAFKNLKTPLKRRIVNKKNSLSSTKKFNIDTGNSLDVTFTNALLDCPELQEKIADNINQLRGSTFDGSFKLTNTPDKTKEILECKDAITIDDEAQTNLIKLVVDKTQQDPLFEQLIGEVLATIDSATGSDSDVLSRPETSTPEKSCASAISSPGSSYQSKLDVLESAIDSQNFPWRQNVAEKTPKESSSDIKNKHMNLLHCNSVGKRMDVLKQNYKENVPEDWDDSSMAVSDTITNQSQSKVIILSNELVATNINHENPVIPLTAINTTNIEQISSSNQVNFKSVNSTEANSTSMIIPIGQLVMADPSIAPIQSMGNVQNVRHIICGKPSDLVISNINHTETHLTESKIMNMPTIIMFNSFDNATDLSNAVIVNDYEDNPVLLPGGNIMYKSIPDINLPPKSDNASLAIKTSPGNLVSMCNLDRILPLDKYNLELKVVDSNGVNFISNIGSVTGANKPLESVQTNVESDNVNDVPNCEDNECVIIESSFVNSKEANDVSKMKTPDRQQTTKKFSTSSPIRSHIRVLDFTTPDQGITKKMPFTSPNILKNSRKPFSDKCKSKLFPPLVEVAENDSKLISNETAKNDIGIIKEKANSNFKELKFQGTETIHSKIQVVGEEINGTNVIKIQSHENYCKNKDVKKTTESSWDRDLRKFTSGLQVIVAPKKRKKKNTCAKKKKAKLSDSIESESKKIEAALMNKSMESKVGSTKKRKIKNDTSKSKKAKKDSLNDTVDLGRSLDKKMAMLEEDLNLSGNTLSDNAVDTTLHSSIDTSNKSKSSENTKKKKNSESLKTPLSARKKNVDLSRESAVMISGSKSKKCNVGTFKIKLGNHEKNKKSTPETCTIGKFNKCTGKSVGFNNSDDSKISEINKLDPFEGTVDNPIHITPDFPKEMQLFPISSVKRNLRMLLDTPLKSDLLNMSLPTPKYLSPSDNLGPISTVKMLGIPTPNFGDTSKLSTCKETTPLSQSSRHTDYSSCGSYYKPDEIDDSNDVFSNKPEKETQKNIETGNEKPSGKSLCTRVLRPRPLRIFHRRKTPPITNNSSNKSLNLKTKKKCNEKKVGKNETSSKENKYNDLFYNSDGSSSDSDSHKTLNEIVPPLTAVKNNVEVKLQSQDQKQMSLEHLKRLEEIRKRTILKINSEQPKHVYKGRKSVLNKLGKKAALKKMPVKVSKEKIELAMKSKEHSIKIMELKLEPIPEHTIKNLIDKDTDKLLVNPSISKSRRKSSTPRRLEKFDTPVKNNDVIRNILSELSDTGPKNLIKKPKVTFDSNVINVPDVQDKIKQPEIESSDSKLNEEMQIDISNQEVDSELNNKIEEVVICEEISANNLESCKNEICVESEVILEEDGSVNVNDVKIDVEEHAVNNSHSTNELIEDDEEVFWGSSECHSGSNNYYSIVFDKKKKIKSHSLSENVNLNDFILNVDVFNDVLNENETRSIKVSEFSSLLDIKSNLKKRKSKKKTEEAVKTRPLQVLLDEMSCSTSESLSPFKSATKQYESTQSDDETSRAVKSLENVFTPCKEPEVVIEAKEIDSPISEAKRIMDDKLMDFSVTGKEADDVNKQQTCGNTKEKDFKDDQRLLEEMDIEYMLRHIHGPE